MNDKGFFPALLDLSFSELVTTKVIKVLYVLGILLAAIQWLAWVFMANGFVGFMIGLVGGGVMFFFSVVLLRVSLELIMVIFRISDDVREMVALKRNGQ